MKSILVNLTPSSGNGFANQMYMFANSVLYATMNNINILFYTKFLKQIHSHEHCNIGDIIDIPQMNSFLRKYNVVMADYNNYFFKVESIQYGNNNFKIDITKQLNTININKSFSFKSINKEIYDTYYRKYSIPLNTKQMTLFITWVLDGTVYTTNYDIINDYMEDDIILHFDDIQTYTFVPLYSDSPIFFDTKINIKFKPKFKEEILAFIKEHIDTNNKINCIHLRLEDDAITAWAKQRNMDILTYKQTVEDKYINEIIRSIKKEDITIILSHNYDNNVIKFLKDNNYNFITTPIWSEFRDISAIYDLHIGEYCNNTYICVFESTFSYLLLYRIKSKINNWVSIIYNN